MSCESEAESEAASASAPAAVTAMVCGDSGGGNRTSQSTGKEASTSGTNQPFR